MNEGELINIYKTQQKTITEIVRIQKQRGLSIEELLDLFSVKELEEVLDYLETTCGCGGVISEGYEDIGVCEECI
ncbi:hypothetical protein ACFL54_09050 [Planctomycetota bacterium]